MLADVLNVTLVFGLCFCMAQARRSTIAQQAIIPNIVPEDFVSRAVALNATIGKASTLGAAGRPSNNRDRFLHLPCSSWFMLVSAAAYLWLPRLARMPRTERSLSMLIAGITYADKLHCLWRHRFGFVHRSGGVVRHYYQFTLMCCRLGQMRWACCAPQPLVG